VKHAGGGDEIDGSKEGIDGVKRRLQNKRNETDYQKPQEGDSYTPNG